MLTLTWGLIRMPETDTAADRRHDLSKGVIPVTVAAVIVVALLGGAFAVGQYTGQQSATIQRLDSIESEVKKLAPLSDAVTELRAHATSQVDINTGLRRDIEVLRSRIEHLMVAQGVQEELRKQR